MCVRRAEVVVVARLVSLVIARGPAPENVADASGSSTRGPLWLTQFIQRQQKASRTTVKLFSKQWIGA